MSTAAASAVQQTSRTVIKSVLAVAQSEGVGATVKRSIGSAKLRNLSPFLMLGELDPSRSRPNSESGADVRFYCSLRSAVQTSSGCV